MFGIIELYRNPIFGVIVLFAIVLVIVIMDSVRVAYAKKRKKESLENLSKNFDSFSLQHNIHDFIQHVKNPTPTIMGIAEIYTKIGDYEQAIAIYQILSENTTHLQDKIHILEMLAKNYYKAGFLQRSKAVFLEILHLSPYNIEALNYLMRISENLGQYQEALDALDCLEELQDKGTSQESLQEYIFKNRNYLKVMQIISDTKLSLIKQQERLLEFLNQDKSLNILILKHFKLYNIGLFWQKILESQDIYSYVDILWHFEPHEIPFESIQTNPAIMDIYRAKGYIQEYKMINNFTLESLQLFQQHSQLKGELEFSYRCNACATIVPFYSYRCPVCAEIGKLTLSFQAIQYVR